MAKKLFGMFDIDQAIRDMTDNKYCQEIKPGEKDGDGPGQVRTLGYVIREFQRTGTKIKDIHEHIFLDEQMLNSVIRLQRDTIKRLEALENARKPGT